jgi:hypothetical protein
VQIRQAVTVVRVQERISAEEYSAATGPGVKPQPRIISYTYEVQKIINLTLIRPPRHHSCMHGLSWFVAVRAPRAGDEFPVITGVSPAGLVVGRWHDE